jgi:hypothetical protein
MNNSRAYIFNLIKDQILFEAKKKPAEGSLFPETPAAAKPAAATPPPSPAPAKPAAPKSAPAAPKAPKSTPASAKPAAAPKSAPAKPAAATPPPAPETMEYDPSAPGSHGYNPFATREIQTVSSIISSPVKELSKELESGSADTSRKEEIKRHLEKLRLGATEGETEEVPQRPSSPPRPREDRRGNRKSILKQVSDFVSRLKDPSKWQEASAGFRSAMAGTTKTINQRVAKLKSERDDIMDMLHPAAIGSNLMVKKIHGLEGFEMPEHLRGSDASEEEQRRAIAQHVLQNPEHAYTRITKQIDDTIEDLMLRGKEGGTRLRLGRAAGSFLRGYMRSPLERSESGEGISQLAGRYLRAKRVFGRGNYGYSGLGIPDIPGIAKPSESESGRRVD